MSQLGHLNAPKWDPKENWEYMLDMTLSTGRYLEKQMRDVFQAQFIECQFDE